MEIEEKEFKKRFEEQEKVLREKLAKYYENDTPQNIQPIIEQIKVAENFSLNKNRFFCLFDQVNFFPVYFSENIIQFGYTPEDVYNMAVFEAIKRIYWKHFSFVLKVHKWGDKFDQMAKNISVQKRHVYYCGIKLKDRFGNIKTIFIKQKFLTATNTNKPILSFLEVEDISPLFKADFYWCRYFVTEQQIPIKRAFFSSGSKKEYGEILSPREITILKLIIENKDSNAISQILGISKETVMKHRKNMIKKIGAKDITALIYFCQLCDLF